MATSSQEDRAKRIRAAIEKAKGSGSSVSQQGAQAPGVESRLTMQPMTREPAPIVSATRAVGLQGLQKAGDIINQVEGVLAGVVKYQRGKLAAVARGDMSRLESMKPDPVQIAKAAYHGSRDRTKYAEALEGIRAPLPPIPGIRGLHTFEPGKLLDVAAPLTMALPIDKPVRMAVGAGKKGAGVGIRAINKAADKHPFTAARAEEIREVGGGIRQLFDQPYRLRSKGISGISEIQSRHLGRIQAIQQMKRHEKTKQMDALVPDPKQMEEVYAVVDMAPVKRHARPVEAILKAEQHLAGLGKQRERMVRRLESMKANRAALENDPNILKSLQEAKGSAREKYLASVGKNIDELSASELQQIEKLSAAEKAKAVSAKVLKAAAKKRDVAGAAIDKERARAAVQQTKKGIGATQSALRKEGKAGAKALTKDFQTQADKQLANQMAKVDGKIIRAQKEIDAIDNQAERYSQNVAMIRDIEEQVRTGEYQRRMDRYEFFRTQLSTEQQQAADLGRQVADEIESERLAGMVLAPETAYGVEQRGGHRYVARIPASKDQALAAINRFIEAEGPKPWALDMKKRIESMPRSPFTQMVRKARGKVIRQTFSKERKIQRTMDEMGEMRGIFDQDLPKVLEVARVETARAIADRKYLAEAIKYLESIGFVKNLDDIGGKLGKDWAAIPDYFPGIPKGKVIPKDIADEVLPMLARTVDEAGINFAYHMADRATSVYRNWNLFVSPEYFIRNVVGNYFNNYAVHGMGPSAMQDYVIAGKYNARHSLGQLSDTEKVPLVNMTETELFKWLEEHRVIGAGQTSEASADFLRGRATVNRGHRLKDLANPTERNPVLRGGHELQRFMENDARLAAFLYQLRHGKTMEQAAEGVFKSLFDYQLGLTKFEREKMRLLMPFYSWPRFNYPLQLEMLSQYPSRYIDMARIGRGIEMTQGGPEPNEAFFPEYMQESTHARIHYDEATKTWYVLSGKNWVPAADLDVVLNPKKWPKEIINMFTPLIKVPAEIATNIDTFRSTPEKIKKIEQYPGETENILGADVSKRYVAYPARQWRLTRMIENIRDELKKDAPNRGSAAVMRTLVGKAQPIQEEESRQRFLQRSDSEIRDIESRLGWAIRDKDEANEKRLRKKLQEAIDKRAKALEADNATPPSR